MDKTFTVQAGRMRNEVYYMWGLENLLSNSLYFPKNKRKESENSYQKLKRSQ